MFGDFEGTGLLILDILRWISIVWVTITIGWLTQIAVITRSIMGVMLVSGLALSLFMDLGDQFDRLGETDISYRFPLTYVELILITIGMNLFVRSRPQFSFVPPYVFLYFRVRKPPKAPFQDDG